MGWDGMDGCVHVRRGVERGRDCSVFSFLLFSLRFFFLWIFFGMAKGLCYGIGGGGGTARDDGRAIVTMMGRFNELRW